MMHILGSVFLTAGRILLVLLVAALVLLLLVLLCPFSYRADLRFDTARPEKTDIRAVLCLPLRVLQAEVRLAGRQKAISFRVLGLPVPFSDTRKKEERKSRTYKSKRKSPKSSDFKSGNPERPAKAGPVRIGSLSEDHSGLQKQPESRPHKNMEPTDRKRRHRDPESGEAPLKSKGKSEEERMQRLNGPAFLLRAETREAIALVWDKLLRLIRCLMPKKMNGRIEGGFEDPSLTGELLALWAAAIPLHKGKLEVVPDFETDQGYGMGEVSLSGRFIVCRILFLILRVLLDRNIRSLRKELRNC